MAPVRRASLGALLFAGAAALPFFVDAVFRLAAAIGVTIPVGPGAPHE